MSAVALGEWNLEEADRYVRRNVLDWEDFIELNEEGEEGIDKKYARLNVAYRTLRNVYSGYVIPNEAVYYFAAVLASVYNDTLVQAQRGVASFSVRGLAFTFKDWAKKDLDEYITDDIDGIIQDANDEDKRKTRGVRVRFGVM